MAGSDVLDSKPGTRSKIGSTLRLPAYCSGLKSGQVHEKSNGYDCRDCNLGKLKKLRFSSKGPFKMSCTVMIPETSDKTLGNY